MLRNATNLITIVIVLVFMLMIAGCASKKPPPDPVDSATDTLQRSAAGAYQNGRYRQAQTLYQNVLNAALTRDDRLQIIDARFNLALVATALGNYPQAQLHLDQAEAERERHGLSNDRAITLLRATTDYRSGNLRRAEAGAMLLINDPDTNTETLTRAHFIIGLAAASQADIGKLGHHMAAIKDLGKQPDSTDYIELQAHQSGLEGDVEQARQQFDLAIEKRRDARDYRGMVRTLAACGDMLSTSNPAIAANYYLRAGRSGAQRDEPETRQWLNSAIKYGKDNLILVAEAQQLLEQMN